MLVCEYPMSVLFHQSKGDFLRGWWSAATTWGGMPCMCKFCLFLGRGVTGVCWPGLNAMDE